MKTFDKIRNLLGVQSRYKYFFSLVITTFVYFIFGRLGLYFDAVSGFASLVWAPAGISLAILFIFGNRLAPAILAGAFLTNMVSGAPLFVALGIAFGNMLEAVIGVLLLRKLSFKPSLSRARDVVVLFIPSVLLSSLLGSGIGVMTLALGEMIVPGTYYSTWIAWWVGDMVGALVFAPVIMIWSAPTIYQGFRSIFTIGQRFELITAFIFLIFTNFTVFFAITGSVWTDRSFSYLIFMPLIWISLRFRQRGAVTAIFITSIIAIWGTVNHSGPFIGVAPDQGLIALQLFMGAASLTILILSATVSEKAAALEALKFEHKKNAEEKARTEAVFLSIGDGLVVTDDEGKILMINKAFEEMLGWTREEVVGEIFVDIVPKEDEKGSRIPKEARTIPRMLQGHPITNDPSQVHYLVRKDGTRFPVSSVVNTISNIHIAGVVQAFRDITREKEVDKAKTEFVSLASHQLRTPATNMKWFLEMLLTGEIGELNEKQKEYFEEVYKNNKRMIVLINTILNVSRIELGIFEVAPVPTDITKVISGVLDEHKTMIDSKELLVSEVYGDINPVMEIDPKLLRIVLHNLISNAVKYTKNNGDITVEIFLKNKDEEIGGQILKKDSMIISVKDTGYGIPKEQFDKIFSRLFRASNVRKKDTDGTGLGLYMTKMIIDHTDGNLWFESELDVGTTFFVAIPLEGMKKRKGIKELSVG